MVNGLFSSCTQEFEIQLRAHRSISYGFFKHFNIKGEMAL